jgi:hypothetical protein
MVHREATVPTTLAPVALPDPANRTLAILLDKQGLVLRLGMTKPAGLSFLGCQDKTLPASILAVIQPREVLGGFLLPTAVADRQTVANALMLDPMDARPGQVGSHEGKRRPCPSGHFSDRQTGAEQVRDLVHERYLKRKQ